MAITVVLGLPRSIRILVASYIAGYILDARTGALRGAKCQSCPKMYPSVLVLRNAMITANE